MRAESDQGRQFRCAPHHRGETGRLERIDRPGAGGSWVLRSTLTQPHGISVPPLTWIVMPLTWLELGPQ